MSKDYRHGQAQLLKSSKSRKNTQDPVPRLVKTFSEHHAKNLLRDAVKFQNMDFYEEYNEDDAIIAFEGTNSCK